MVLFLFAKLNKVRSQSGRREDNKILLLDFFRSLEGKADGLEGFLILDDLADEQETVILTLWETREQMNDFYKPENVLLSKFMEDTEQFTEGSPQPREYQVVKLKI